MVDVTQILNTHVEQIKRNIKKERIYERNLNISLIKGKSIIIMGPRRAGKTYFLYYLARDCKKKWLFFNFEDLLIRHISLQDILIYIIAKKAEVVFLDEIQEKEDWYYFVRSLLDRGIDVVITGSSSKILSKEIATQLRGRSMGYILLPFSFKEYLLVKNVNEKINTLEEKEKIKQHLRDYILKGGFPEIIIKKDINKMKLLREYYDLIFFRDFVERKNIKNIKTARIIFDYLITNYAKEISLRSIQGYLKTLNIKTNISTITSYLYEIEDTFSIFLLSPYHSKIHLREGWPKKIYVVDTGLCQLFEISENIGKKMENAVFLKLKRKENDNPLQEIYYYKTKEGYEVDFLIKEGMQIKELIQVTYANSYEDIPEREIRALLHAKEDLNLSNDVPLTVITWDYEDEKEVEWWRKKGKIRFVPLWKWLLKIE